MSRRVKTLRVRTMRADRMPLFDEPTPQHERPKTRGDCPPERPCPYVGCRYNLSIDVGPSGSIVFNGGTEDDPFLGCDKNCALDWADNGPCSLELIGGTLGVTRERVRQIAVLGLAAAARRLGPDVKEELLDALRAADAGPTTEEVVRRGWRSHMAIPVEGI